VSDVKEITKVRVPSGQMASDIRHQQGVALSSCPQSVVTDAATGCQISVYNVIRAVMRLRPELTELTSSLFVGRVFDEFY
jgi:hypothetical protein